MLALQSALRPSGFPESLQLPHEVEAVLDLIFTIEENEPQRGRDLPIQ